MSEPLTLILDAKTEAFVKGVRTAATALERLRKVAEKAAAGLAASMQGIGAATSTASVSLDAIGSGATEALSGLRAFSKGATDAFEDVADAAQDAEKKTKGALGGVGKAAEQELKGVGDVLEEHGEKLKKSVLNMKTAIATLGAGVAIKKIVDTTADFGQAVAYVGTILDGTGVPLARYHDQLLDLGGRTTQDAVERSKTLYQILSSGIPATEGAAGAGAVLETTLKAATAGMANAEDAAKAITGVMNAYSQSGITAAQASDVLFQTVNRGVIEFPELARLFGQVSGVAASLGVKLPEVGAAIATITKAGIPAESAVSGLRQAILSIAKPPVEVQKNLKAMGIEFGTAALAEKGFAGVLKEVIDKTGGTSDVMTKLFTDVDGLKAVLALTRGGIGGFQGDIDALANSTGSTDKAFKLLSETFAFQADVLKNKVQTLLINIGEKVLPQLQQALARLGDFIDANQGRIADAVGGFLSALVSVGAFIAQHGPSILAFLATMFAVKTISSATQAMVSFGQALSTAVANSGGGAAAGANFASGFTGALGGLGGVISGILRSPTLLGLVVGAGVMLGQALGDAIGKKMTEGIDEAGRVAEQNAKELADRIDATLKAKGWASMGERDEKRAKFLSGALVSGADGGAFQANALITPKQAVESFGPKGARESAAATALAIEKEALKVAADRVSMEEKLKLVERKQGQATTDDETKAWARQSETLRDQIVTMKNREQAARDGAVAVVAAVEEEIAAHKKNKPDTRSAREITAAEKAARRQEVIAETIAQVSAETARERVENEQTVLAQTRSAAEERLAIELAAAKAAGASEMELLALRRHAFDEADALYQQQVAGLQAAADEEVKVAQAATQKKLDNFKDSADAQLAIAAKGAEDEKAIRLKADQQVRDAIAQRAKQDEELRQAEFAALLASEDERIKRELAAEQGRKARAAVMAGERTLGGNGRIVQGAQAVVGAVDGPAAIEKSAASLAEAGEKTGGVLGELAEQGGLIVGTIAGLAQLVAKLPDIFNGIADLLTSGLDNFVGALLDSILNVLLALATKLGPQVIKILTVTLPKFVEALIAAIPEIIGGLIALAPQIVWAVVKSIAYSLPIALYKGVVGAGESIVEFFTSGLPKTIALAVADAFAEVGKVAGRAIAWIFQHTILRVFAILGKLLAGLFAGLFSRLGGFFASAGKAIASVFASAGKQLAAGVKDAFMWIIQKIKKALGAAGDFVSDLWSGGNSITGRVGRSLGISGAKKLLTGDFESLSTKDIPIIGGFFHSGGQVRGGGANLGGALALAAAGAQRFASGGFVQAPGAQARARLRRVLGSDDTPSILQAGEAVLNRVGAKTAGEDGVAALNRGQMPSSMGGGLQANVSLIGREVRPLLQMLLSSVAIDISSPNGVTRQAVHKRTSRAPLMARAVRGRV